RRSNPSGPREGTASRTRATHAGDGHRKRRDADGRRHQTRIAGSEDTIATTNHKSQTTNHKQISIRKHIMKLRRRSFCFVLLTAVFASLLTPSFAAEPAGKTVRLLNVGNSF